MSIITNETIPDITNPEVVHVFMGIEAMLSDRGYNNPHDWESGLRWDKLSWSVPLGMFIKTVDKEHQVVSFKRYLLQPAEVRSQYFQYYLKFIVCAVTELGKMERSKANRAI